MDAATDVSFLRRQSHWRRVLCSHQCNTFVLQTSMVAFKSRFRKRDAQTHGPTTMGHNGPPRKLWHPGPP